jgi:hypothetical protein
MSYRSLALFAAALTSAQVATADAQVVYVAPGGVYVGAGPVYVIPAPPNGAPPPLASGAAGAPVVVAPRPAGAPVVVVPAGANGTQVHVGQAPENGAPVTAYAATGRANAAPPPVKREPAFAARERPSVAPPAHAAGIAPRPPAAVPYNGNKRCVVYGRREYCD